MRTLYLSKALMGVLNFFASQVADSKDVFPLASCFDGKEYELSWQRRQWQWCRNNVPKVQELPGTLAFFSLHYCVRRTQA